MLYIHIVSIKLNLTDGAPRAPRGAPHGFQTGSGHTGFSQKGHISLHFAICCCLSAHVLPHFATCLPSLPHFEICCKTFTLQIHYGSIAALLRRPRLTRPRPEAGELRALGPLPAAAARSGGTSRRLRGPRLGWHYLSDATYLLNTGLICFYGIACLIRLTEFAK